VNFCESFDPLSLSGTAACHFLSPRESRPGGLSQAYQTLLSALPCVDQKSAEVLVAVAWHTSAERTLRQDRLGRQHVLWSHGLGTLIVFQARPLRGMLRCLWRLPQLFAVIATLRGCDRLVVAYPRTNCWDERSFDVVLARWLHVPISVIGNPVDTDFWRPAAVRCDFAGGAVLSIGRLEWQKGHAQALSIVSDVSPELRLQVLAPVETIYGESLQSQADRQGHPNQLELLLGLVPEQRRQLVQQALCLISWSETEYQSLAMLEALACGCPVVARPRGWLCHEPIPGVLVARSRNEAGHYLRQLQEQPAWREELGQAGRAYVLERHALAVVAQQWNRLLQELT